jgi:hypothetical protein
VTAVLDRLYAGWVYGGVLSGLLLLALMPVLTDGWPPVAVLTFASLPVYMLHQYEEHDDDRFRRFVNRYVAHGVEALTLRDVFVINIVGVWGVFGAIIAATRLAGAGWGVLAADLVLVNAAAHVGQAVAMGRYNPGLASAVVLFLPLGAWLFSLEWRIATPLQQGCGILIAMAIHALIIVHVKRALRSVPSPSH